MCTNEYGMKIVSIRKQWLILMRVAGQPPNEPVYHLVTRSSVGMVTLDEYIQKYTGKVPLNSSISYSWEEFAGKHPDEAALIEKCDVNYHV